MTRMQYQFSAVFIAVMLCPLGVYGGVQKQGRALKSSVAPISVRQGMGRRPVINQEPELAALDANTRAPSWAGDDRQQARVLFARLKQCRIAIQPTFYQMLGMAPQGQRGKLISRCQAFFDSVDTQEVPSTGCLTSMIRNKTHVRLFLLQSHDSIRRVARTPALRSLTSLFNRHGFPQAEEDTQDFINWPIWWRGGEASGRILDRDLLRIFSSMLSGKGLPEQWTVNNYLEWDVWWRRIGKARILDRDLLRTFSSMFNCKGLPGKQVIEDFLQWEIWWQGEGESRTLDRELLRTFSSMFHGKGLPDKRVVDDYLQLDVWWQRDGQARTLDRKLLRIISSILGSKGLPDKKSVQEYLQWPIWWQGEGEARTLDREFLRTFSGMFYNKGLPDKQVIEDYLQWPIWWRGEGEARTLNRDLLCAVASIYYGKGLPDKLRTDQILPRRAIKSLLLAQQPLFDHGAIPPGLLARTHDQSEGVVIRVNPAVGVEDSITLFIRVIAVLLAQLRATGYVINEQSLTLWPRGDSVPITFPTPSLACHPDGVQIRHWTLAHLYRFYRATGCPKWLYLDPTDPSDPVSAPPLPGIENSNHTIDVQPPAVSLEILLKQGLLSEADIDQLYNCRDQLTNDNVIDVFIRMDHSVPRDTVQQWYLLLNERHHRALTTDPPRPDGRNLFMEGVHDSETILRDLFPEALL